MCTEARRYVYILVRKDLELKNIIVQTAHASYESAKEFKNNADRTTIIVLEVKDSIKLNDAKIYLNSNGIDWTVYTEKSLGFGETAISTEALNEEQRKIMRKFQLLKV